MLTAHSPVTAQPRRRPSPVRLRACQKQAQAGIAARTATISLTRPLALTATAPPPSVPAGTATDFPWTRMAATASTAPLAPPRSTTRPLGSRPCCTLRTSCAGSATTAACLAHGWPLARLHSRPLRLRCQAVRSRSPCARPLPLTLPRHCVRDVLLVRSSRKQAAQSGSGQVCCVQGSVPVPPSRLRPSLTSRGTPSSLAPLSSRRRPSCSCPCSGPPLLMQNPARAVDIVLHRGSRSRPGACARRCRPDSHMLVPTFTHASAHLALRVAGGRSRQPRVLPFRRQVPPPKL